MVRSSQLTYKQVFDFDRFGNLYRKAASNPTAGQQNPIAFTTIEEESTPGTGDIDKTKNQFRPSTGTTYDDAGQVTTDNKFRSMSFGYDANGRQIKASRASVPDAWTVYDAGGNRVATNINNQWRYMVYDAMGKLVAEYGQQSDGLGGVSYVQQDWQGSVRTVTNANGFAVARTDHQAFGGEVGYGVGQRTIDKGFNQDSTTRQGYGLTERDEASGQDHTWFRKNENLAGRWTSPDPYNGSMNLGDPQSFNRYSYVTSDPVNYVDPSGLNEDEPIRVHSWTWREWDEHWGADNGGDFGWMYDPPGPGIGPNGGGGGGYCPPGTPCPQPAPTPPAARDQQKKCDEAKKRVVDVAKSQVGSKEWSVNASKGGVPAGKLKCNLFVYDVLNGAGVAPPRSGGVSGIVNAWVIDTSLTGNAPLARDWGSDATMGQWIQVSGPAQPGDIIAESHDYSDATGHSGVVVGANSTVSQSTVTDSVAQNDWGFRSSQHPVLHRLNCASF